jgi:hypothetical protein
LALATRAGNADVQAQWTLFLPALVAARADGISAVEIRASGAFTIICAQPIAGQHVGA